jgi:SAM-dependent methyltransferase
MLRRILTHPLASNLNLDEVNATLVHRKIIEQKLLLIEVYQDWYRQAAALIPSGAGAALEIGSGPGFLQQLCPEVIQSDILRLPDVDLILDGQALPFCDGSLRAVVVVNVLHHIPDPNRFFREIERGLSRQGVLIMIEPWMTPWSKFIYRNFHHEPCDANTPKWQFDSSGPLSSANEALPWIIFMRDRAEFEKFHPNLQIVSVSPHTAFTYLISGGLSMRSLLPNLLNKTLVSLERSLSSRMNNLAMFATIVINKA